MRSEINSVFEKLKSLKGIASVKVVECTKEAKIAIKQQSFRFAGSCFAINPRIIIAITRVP